MIGVELLVEIQFLARQGLSKTQIARRLGVDRKTVRKCLAQDVRDFDKNRALASCGPARSPETALTRMAPWVRGLIPGARTVARTGRGAAGKSTPRRGRVPPAQAPPKDSPAVSSPGGGRA